MIVMGPEALRAGTAKAGSRSNKKLKTRLAKGEKTNGKLMADVTAVDDVAPVVGVPADIIAALGVRLQLGGTGSHVGGGVLE